MLSKYYPSSQTVHVRKDDTHALCGRAAPRGWAGGLELVTCRDCRAIVEQNGAHGGGGLAGLLQAIALTAAGKDERQRLAAGILEVLTNGRRDP